MQIQRAAGQSSDSFQLQGNVNMYFQDYWIMYDKCLKERAALASGLWAEPGHLHAPVTPNDGNYFMA